MGFFSFLFLSFLFFSFLFFSFLFFSFLFFPFLSFPFLSFLFFPFLSFPFLSFPYLLLKRCLGPPIFGKSFTNFDFCIPSSGIGIALRSYRANITSEIGVLPM